MIVFALSAFAGPFTGDCGAAFAAGRALPDLRRSCASLLPAGPCRAAATAGGALQGACLAALPPADRTALGAFFEASPDKRIAALSDAELTVVGRLVASLVLLEQPILAELADPSPPPPVLNVMLGADGVLRVAHGDRDLAGVSSNWGSAFAGLAGLPALKGATMRLAVDASVPYAQVIAVMEAARPWFPNVELVVASESP